MPVYWRRGGSATFDLLLQNSPITKQKGIGSFIVTLMNSPITKRCFVIAFSPFGRRTSFLSKAKNLYHLRFWGSFDNAAFSRPARHEHYPCYVRPFAVGINFVEPAFARSEIKVNLYLACLIAALSKPAAFVASLARDDRCGFSVASLCQG